MGRDELRSARRVRKSRTTIILLSILWTLVATLAAMWISHTNIGRNIHGMLLDWRLKVGSREITESPALIVHLNRTTLDRYADTGWPLPKIGRAHV